MVMTRLIIAAPVMMPRSNSFLIADEDIRCDLLASSLLRMTLKMCAVGLK